MIVIVRYSEIALKGKRTRSAFERILRRNIEKQTGGKTIQKQARILLYGGKWKRLRRVFGVHSFSPAIETDADIDHIKEAARNVEVNGTFAVRAQRVTKNFPMTSTEINRDVGEYLVKTGKKVNLSNPDTEIGIEIIGRKAYIFTERFPGPGGLPYGASGKAVALISSGYDSPVAVWLGARRGLEVVSIHFGKEENIREIKEHIDSFLPYPMRVRYFSLEKIHEMLKDRVKRKNTCIACKAVMYKVASRVAKEEKAHCIITGESVGQVASQTIKNIAFLDKLTDLPVIRPFAFTDKEEIIKMSRQLGFYPLKKEKKCVFAPKHPSTAGPGEESRKIELLAEEIADALCGREE